MNRFICIHGHFYQPPRENPWLEEIEVQDSAYPYRDWNERINAECYNPNTASRILGGNKNIIDIINNYSKAMEVGTEGKKTAFTFFNSDIQVKNIIEQLELIN